MPAPGLKARWHAPPPQVNPPRESPQGGYTDFDHGTVRFEADVRAEIAPNPYPSATSYAGVGRDSAHATSRHDRVTVLAFSEWLGVMAHPAGEFFGAIPRVLGAVIIPMSNRVVQKPIGFMPEIQSPRPSDPNQSIQAVPAGEARASFTGWADSFAKLRGGV